MLNFEAFSELGRHRYIDRQLFQERFERRGGYMLNSGASLELDRDRDRQMTETKRMQSAPESDVDRRTARGLHAQLGFVPLFYSVGCSIRVLF